MSQKVLESGGVGSGEFGEHFAVQGDVLFLEGADEFAVRGAVLFEDR